MPFVAANAAAALGEQAAVVCTIEAVRLGTAGGCEGVQADGHPPLQQLVDTFVENGGEVWLCSACTRPRGISDESLMAGARIVGAAYVVEQIGAGARAISFA